MITPRLHDEALAADRYTDRRFSDHAPQIMDYEREITARADRHNCPGQ
ncbi:hypothetical protein [Seongchinamella unica]|nr:hypothetical protein [Seongchinamella unica]